MSQVKEQTADYQLDELTPVLKAANSGNTLLASLPVWLSAQTRKSAGRGRSASNTLQYGVQKLRELILELAVRGKLVPQDSNDEPASILLEKVTKEKERLVKEGKIKKQKTTPASNLSEDKFSLPMNWKWAFLPDISSYAPGKTPPTKNAKFWGNENDIPWVSIADMTQFGVLSNTSKTVTQAAKDEVFKAEPVKAGAILMSFKLTVGKVSINEMPTFHNEAIISIFPFSGVDRSYLFKVLPMRALAGNSKSAIKGNTLNAESIAEIKIPVPPYDEQQRIVKKVDELMALCDQLEKQQADAVQAHDTLVKVLLDTLTQSENADDFQQNWRRIAEHFDTLFNTESSIDQLKQNLLQLAVMGKLVPQDPDDEPASILLEKIAAKKAMFVEQGNIKKQKPTPEIQEDEKPFPLPRGWNWARLPEIGELARGKSKHRPRNDPALYIGGEIPLVQTGDVARADGVIKTFSAHYNETGLKQSKLWHKGTLCITIAANIADTAILGFDACFPDSVVGFIPTERSLNIRYFEYFIRTAKEHLNDFAPSTAQKNINLEILNQLLVPMPPAAELNAIVVKVDNLMTICDQLKDRLNQAHTLQQQLANSMVETALN